MSRRRRPRRSSGRCRQLPRLFPHFPQCFQHRMFSSAVIVLQPGPVSSCKTRQQHLLIAASSSSHSCRHSVLQHLHFYPLERCYWMVICFLSLFVSQLSRIRCALFTSATAEQFTPLPGLHTRHIGSVGSFESSTAAFSFRRSITAARALCRLLPYSLPIRKRTPMRKRRIEGTSCPLNTSIQSAC